MKKKPLNNKVKEAPRAVVSEATKLAFKTQLEKAVEKARRTATQKALERVKNNLTWIQSDPSGEILMDFNGKRFYISEGEMVSL
jgi:hypothetical protein